MTERLVKILGELRAITGDEPGGEAILCPLAQRRDETAVLFSFAMVVITTVTVYGHYLHSTLNQQDFAMVMFQVFGFYYFPSLPIFQVFAGVLAAIALLKYNDAVKLSKMQTDGASDSRDTTTRDRFVLLYALLNPLGIYVAYTTRKKDSEPLQLSIRHKPKPDSISLVAKYVAFLLAATLHVGTLVYQGIRQSKEAAMMPVDIRMQQHVWSSLFPLIGTFICDAMSFSFTEVAFDSIDPLDSNLYILWGGIWISLGTISDMMLPTLHTILPPFGSSRCTFAKPRFGLLATGTAKDFAVENHAHVSSFIGLLTAVDGIISVSLGTASWIFLYLVILAGLFKFIFAKDLDAENRLTGYLWPWQEGYKDPDTKRYGVLSWTGLMLVSILVFSVACYIFWEAVVVFHYALVKTTLEAFHWRGEPWPTHLPCPQIRQVQFVPTM